MKKILIAFLLTTVVLSLSAVDVTVVSLTGSVEIKEPGGNWTAASTGQVVSSRSMISTGFGSRARLDAGGMMLNLQPLTRVTIDSLTQDGDVTRTQVSLQSGRVRASRPPVTRATQRSVDFRVSTPVATAAVRGTDFELSFDKLVTYEGLVEFSQGQAVIMSPGGTFSWAVEGLNPIDPVELAANGWSVSPDAGTIPGDSSSGGGSSSTVKALGHARISLQ